MPPDGAAAELIRETGTGIVVAPDDIDGIRAALTELHERYRTTGLQQVEIPAETRHRLSRRARAEELAALLGEL